ncbi:MAG: macrolide transporter subunit MacA [Firmicutes bacterium ADurb.Bin248]|nr:MAG: macrolide transporter subunit MacA [Firmicutes bacterium ADurb.Bin248]HOF99570.1 HlyD family efflux transporter periplasmic adaptor subunit [Clostridia bacterium]
MQNRKKRRWPWVVLALVLTLLLAGAWLVRQARLAAQAVTYETYTVKKGSITSTVTGSGRLESADTRDVELPEGVDFAEVNVSVGDSVREGDRLAAFDPASLEEHAATLSSELASIDAELARMSGAKTVETVYAPVAGRLKALNVGEGSDVRAAVVANGSLALISTDGLMQVEVETSAAPALAAAVRVEWDGGGEEGTVAAFTESGVIVTLDDARAPYGQTARVYDGDTLVGEGALAIHAPAAVLATGGAISKIHCDIDDKLTLATKLFTLENGPFTSAYQLKYNQRQDVADKLAEVMGFLADPVVRAPADGIVSAVNATAPGAAGSSSSSAGAMAAASASSKSAAFTLLTGGAIKMTVSVDELDISTIALGQSAAVTLDAFPAKEFKATVTRISNIGQTAKSVAAFAVELTLEADGRLMQGMNGSATILVERLDGVLLLPVAAINEDADGAFVYLGEDLVKTYVETGLSDGENAVVTSGLSEGDVVKYADGETMYQTLLRMRDQFEGRG